MYIDRKKPGFQTLFDKPLGNFRLRPFAPMALIFYRSVSYTNYSK